MSNNDKQIMSDVEFYISLFNPEVRERLQNIRSIILKNFPGAGERIYHKVPTVMYNGQDLINYGGYKNHITLYLTYELTDFLKSQYPRYHYTKAAMQLYHAEPFPYELVQEICDIFKGQMITSQTTNP